MTIHAKTLELSLEAGPAERLGRLFDRHHRRLYRLALRMSGDPAEAEDLVQEAFLRAARRPGSVPRGEGPAEAWLVRVLVNLCRDRWRRLRVRRTAGPAPRWSLRAPASPESRLQADSAVSRALDTLRPRTRAVVVMHEIEGRGRDDIARLLGITETTVRWHLSTGRQRLLKELEGEP